jgi:hypothetical protein
MNFCCFVDEEGEGGDDNDDDHDTDEVGDDEEEEDNQGDEDEISPERFPSLNSRGSKQSTTEEKKSDEGTLCIFAVQSNLSIVVTWGSLTK